MVPPLLYYRRITAPLYQGRFMLGPALAAFRPLHPFVSVGLVLDNDHRPMIDDGFDVALRISNLPDSSLVARKVCDVTLKLVASPGYLEKNALPLSLRDISQHICLLKAGASTSSVGVSSRTTIGRSALAPKVNTKSPTLN